MGVAFASGDSMRNVGIFDGDALLFDREQPPRPRDIIIALIDGNQTVKRLCLTGGKCTLMPENGDCQPIAIAEDADVEIIGVVKTWLQKP